MAMFPCITGIPTKLNSDMQAVLNKKMGTSGQTYPSQSWADEVNLMGKLPEKTVSGAIANIKDGADGVSLKELIFSASPVQAAGTPSPSNPLPISGHVEMNGVHCGKNLIKPDKYQAANNQLILGQTNNTAFETFLKAGTYTISYSTTGESCYIYRREENDGSNTNLGKATSKTFTISEDGHFRFWLYGDGAVSANITDVLLEVGSSASSYESFSSETKKWEFPPFGKNLLNPEKVTASSGAYGLTVTFDDGKIHIYGTSSSSGGSVYFNILTYSDYSLSGKGYYVQAFNGNGTGTFKSIYGFITDSEKSIAVGFDFSQSTTIDYTFYISVAETSQSSYEPYQSMFDGSVNALTGKAKNGSVLEAFTEIVTNGVQSQFNFISTTSSMDFLTTCVRIACGLRSGVDTSMFNKVSNTYPADLQRCNILPHYFAYNSDTEHWYRNSVLYIFLPISECGNTKESVVAYLQGLVQQGKALSLILPYASGNEPEVDMDSVDWQTKLGDNNFFNDCGDTSVTYRQDIDLALSALQGSRGLMMASRSVSPMIGEEASLDRENILEEELSENLDNEESEEER